ncbi:MAG TPA: hypothetical protein VL068_11760 [Microthrixaceae bacterium]|nr:hypothetical protein [Microthrixaceae bacterium]
MLTAIEAHIRVNEDPNGWTLVVRGRPLSCEGLLLAASRTLAEFTWRDSPLAAISAEVTDSIVSTADLLSGSRLRTRRTHAAAPVADVVAAGFPVLATFSAPHVSIVLPKYDEESVYRLLDVLGPELPNPYFRRSTT